MSYFHVIVEVNEKNMSGSYVKYYELDNTDLDDIRNSIIQPYLKKSTIFIDGRYIDASEVRMLKVKTSDSSTEELRQLAQSKVPPRVFIAHTKNTVLNDTYTKDITKEMLKEAGETLKEFESTKINKAIDDNQELNNNIFIVHGRDELAKNIVARFIEQIGLSAIILHEQSNNGKTIIEKIEENTNVGYGIILYTPCDHGSLVTTDELKPRARQNVVFEHGYLIGKLGRNKVSALIKSDIETPGDINGLVYITLDDAGGWKLALAKELIREGYSIDLNKIL